MWGSGCLPGFSGRARGPTSIGVPTFPRAPRTLALLLCAAGAVGCRGLWDRPFDGGSAGGGEPLPAPRHVARSVAPPTPPAAVAPVEVAPSPPPESARLEWAPPEASRPARAPRVSSGPTPTVEDRATFDEVNRVRVGRGLRPFRWNDRLFRAAYDHSAEQARHGYMGHGSPDPARDALVDRLRQADCAPARQWAEVVAWGYEGPASVTLGWMNSAGHRKILVDPSLEEAGFARVGDYFTGNFAAPMRR